MAEQITLASLANLENETTACAAINSNNSIITTAFQDCLSLTGVSPNQMNTPLDMNSFPIINLPAPGGPNSPARLVDVTTTNPITISLALSGDVTAPASSSVLTTTIANNAITSAKIANNAVTNTDFRQSAGLSVVGNTTNATANVADITGTTRQILSVNTAGTGLVFAQPQGDQLKGTTTNDNASAGNIGEYISSFIAQGSAIGLTSATLTNLTSISLTAGDWDVYGAPLILPATTTNVTAFTASLSTTSVTNDFTNGRFVGNSATGVVPGNFPTGALTPVSRFSLAGTTTIFMVVQANFTVSTLSAFGGIWARRIR